MTTLLQVSNMLTLASPQQAQYHGPMLIQCWASVVDGGPTLGQRIVPDGSHLPVSSVVCTVIT